MPGMDGRVVSQHLRANPVTAGIPLILMSATANLASGAAALVVDALLPKPFGLAALGTLIEHWVSVGRQAKGAQPGRLS